MWCYYMLLCHILYVCKIKLIYILLDEIAITSFDFIIDVHKVVTETHAKHTQVQLKC